MTASKPKLPAVEPGGRLLDDTWTERLSSPAELRRRVEEIEARVAKRLAADRHKGSIGDDTPLTTG